MNDDGIERDGFKSGDCVVITGGGGGFGRAFAKRFGSNGGRIAVWDIDRKLGEEAVDAVCAGGGDATFFHVDLGSADAISRAAQDTMAQYGTPYCLINNASVFPRGEVLALSLQDWEFTFRVNVTAPFLIVKAFGPAMIGKKRGCVINIASGRALEGAPKGANYAATKAAIVSLTKSLALEWAPHRIRVNTIIPGQSLTAMPMVATPREKLIADAASHVPLGRIGYPEDMAGVAWFLASADAAWMTGQGVAMNGGAVMTP
jgi:NAD(P)-dependent dehydrogenase (short-subunit alcohol dehydrogenase family)